MQPGNSLTTTQQLGFILIRWHRSGRLNHFFGVLDRSAIQSTFKGCQSLLPISLTFPVNLKTESEPFSEEQFMLYLL